jgi:hypothetical protein
MSAPLRFPNALWRADYKHGSEPPTYKYVKHRGEVGLVLKLKQVDKG